MTVRTIAARRRGVRPGALAPGQAAESDPAEAEAYETGDVRYGRLFELLAPGFAELAC